MEDTPFTRFLLFIKSGKPAENLSTAQLREFLTVKPERMGLDYPQRWERLRVDAIRILAERDEERRHRESLRVSKYSVAVAVIAAAASVAAAWYAKSQADLAAISARGSAASIDMQQSTQVSPPSSPVASPAPTGSGTPTPKKP